MKRNVSSSSTDLVILVQKSRSPMIAMIARALVLSCGFFPAASTSSASSSFAQVLMGFCSVRRRLRLT